MYNLKKTLIAILGIFIFTFSSAENSQLEVFTENSGESNYIDKNQNIKGYSVEIVTEIIRRIGENYQIKLAPWARAYNMLQSQSNVVLFSTARSMEREKLFKWVGPIAVKEYAFYCNTNDNIKISSLEDAKRIGQIGVMGDDIREQILRKEGFKNISAAFGTEANLQNLMKLESKRIALWFTSYPDILTTTKAANKKPESLKKVFVVEKTYIYIAFSLGVSDQIIAKWQKAFDSMKNDKTYEKIMRKYSTGPSSMTYDAPKASKM